MPTIWNRRCIQKVFYAQNLAEENEKLKKKIQHAIPCDVMIQNKICYIGCYIT